MPNSPFGFDQPEDSPGFLLWQTTMIWQRQIRKALEFYNISHAQFVILAALAWFEANRSDITQIVIVNHTKLDKMTVSKSLKKLVSIGYVKRIEHNVDTRAKNVTLTAKGKKIVHKLIPIVENVDKSFFGKVKKNDQKQISKALYELIQSNDS